MSRRMTPEEKAVNLRVGQRVRIVHDGGQFARSPAVVGCLADVRAVTRHAVEFTVLPRWEGGPTTVQTFSIATLTLRDLLRGDTILKRMKGKPYVPGIDSPRGMGSRKGNPRFTKKAPPASPTSPTSGETPDMSATSDTAAAASALADLVAATAYDRITKTLAPWQKDIEQAVTTRFDAMRGEMQTKFKELDELARDATPVVVSATSVSSASTPTRKVRISDAERAGELDTSNPIVAKLASFYAPGVEAPANILLTSPPSFGKSYAIRSLGAAYDVYLEHGCSDDMDEIATLLGSPVPDGKGGFIMVDGVLTEAVRGAAAGKTTLLLLDEVLRLTPRAQEWLLTFLTGVKMPKGNRIYRLRTRRALPDGTLEVLECASENLHIVGATNLSILSPIEAFWSRWETVRIEFSAEMAQATASAILASYGIKDPRKKLAKAWAGIVRDTRNVVADGKLRFPADFRMLERAAALAPDDQARSVASIALDRLTDNIANWNPDTGDTAPESLALAVSWTKKLAELAADAPTKTEGGADDANA